MYIKWAAMSSKKTVPHLINPVTSIDQSLFTNLQPLYLT